MGLTMCVAVMAISVVTGLIAEAFSWYMVYRKPDYQKLKRQIEMLIKDIDKRKTEPLRITDNDEKKKKSQKAISRLEKELADASKDLQALATPSKMMVAVFAMAVMLGVQKGFAGIVVAKLPFIPFSLVQNISHRKLEGEDPTDCSVAFIFALCQAGLKGNIAKLVGVGQPKGMKEPSPFADLSAPTDEGHAKEQ